MFPDPIVWRLHLKAPAKKVFEALTSDDGRGRFWAEATHEVENKIRFEFMNHEKHEARVILKREPDRLELEYFKSHVVFELTENEKGGTDLVLTNKGVQREEYETVYAGWLSVLFALKGYVDYGIDLRNHDETRTWDQGYIEN